VEAVRPVFWKVVWLPGTVAISEKLPQLTPEQRSIRYRLMPLASVEPAQERSISPALTAVAPRAEGSLGGVLSGGGPPIVRAPKSSRRPAVPRSPIPTYAAAGYVESCTTPSLDQEPPDGRRHASTFGP
jgi:hypothetical protein